MIIQRGQLLGDIYMIVGWLCGAIAICIFIFWFIGYSTAPLVILSARRHFFPDRRLNNVLSPAPEYVSGIGDGCYSAIETRQHTAADTSG